MLKTHNCGELNSSDVGKNVTLAGWLQVRRDHGGLIFLDVRDRSGLAQVTADPSVGEAFSIAEKVRTEYVLQVKGRVRPRPEGTVNPNLSSGEVEVLAQTITILNPSKTVPFPIDDEGDKTDETIRLKYRYYHQFRGFVEAFNQSLCVGCNRCGAACLAGINPKEVIDDLIRTEKQ